MLQRTRARSLSAARASVLLLTAVALVATACAPLPDDAPAPSATSTSVVSATPTPDAVQTSSAPSQSPTAPGSTVPSAVPVPVPTDCAQLLTPALAAELADVPLNDPAFGEAGALDGGGILCLWMDPQADTTSLVVIVQASTPEQTTFAENEILAIAGGTCADDTGGGIRCEASWQNDDFPVTDGRAMYARDGLRIDVQHSNLYPAGLLDSVIAAIWP